MGIMKCMEDAKACEFRYGKLSHCHIWLPRWANKYGKLQDYIKKRKLAKKQKEKPPPHSRVDLDPGRSTVSEITFEEESFQT